MFRVISPLTKSGGGRVVDADLIPLSCDLVYGDEWVHGPGNPDQRTFECLPFERAIATTFDPALLPRATVDWDTS